MKELENKTFLLLDFAEERGDLEIPDPINFELEEYQKIVEKIEKAVIKALRKISDLNKNDSK